MHVAKTKRMLVDLLNTEHGYARILFEQEGYCYELRAYQPAPVADLFACMGGYQSALEACEAARHQLSAVHPQHSLSGRKAKKSRTAKSRPTSRSSARFVQGSIGLL